MTQPASIAEILAQAEDPSYIRTSTARILLRQDLHHRHMELDRQLQEAVQSDAMSNEPDRHPAIAEELTQLEAEIDDAKVSFKFRSIGKRAYADLIAEHPPTSKQSEEYRKIDRRAVLDHNPVTFPSALIVAASLEPDLSADDVARLERALNNTAFDQLYAAALDANTGGFSDPKSHLAGIARRANGASGTTAVNGGSLAASSSDE